MAPLEGSQRSRVQGFPSSAETGVPAQNPAELQVSPVVQAFPSLHAVPGSSPWAQAPFDTVSDDASDPGYSFVAGKLSWA